LVGDLRGRFIVAKKPLQNPDGRVLTRDQFADEDHALPEFMTGIGILGSSIKLLPVHKLMC
jgi:hypothetical protein